MTIQNQIDMGVLNPNDLTDVQKSQLESEKLQSQSSFFAPNDVREAMAAPKQPTPSQVESPPTPATLSPPMSLQGRVDAAADSYNEVSPEQAKVDEARNFYSSDAGKASVTKNYNDALAKLPNDEVEKSKTDKMDRVQKYIDNNDIASIPTNLLTTLTSLDMVAANPQLKPLRDKYLQDSLDWQSASSLQPYNKIDGNRDYNKSGEGRSYLNDGNLKFIEGANALVQPESARLLKLERAKQTSENASERMDMARQKLDNASDRQSSVSSDIEDRKSSASEADADLRKSVPGQTETWYKTSVQRWVRTGITPRTTVKQTDSIFGQTPTAQQATITPPPTQTPTPTANKYSIGQIVFQGGKSYRVKSLSPDGKILSADPSN